MRKVLLVAGIVLALPTSCTREQNISEIEARQISADYATKAFPGSNFTPSAARPYDARTAWVMDYYFPIKQRGGGVVVIVRKDTGEVMVAYAADDSEPRSVGR